MDQASLILDLFKSRVAVINVGIEGLVEHLPSLGVAMVQVDWKPPAGGNLELLKKLKKLNQKGGDF
jgi:FdrA protein